MPIKNIKNKKNYLEWLVFILLILILIYFVYTNVSNLFILEKISLYSEVTLSDKPGFDLNKTALTFGRVVPENAGSRDILIKNDFDKKVLVSITSLGEISDFLIVSKNDFFLMPKEEKNVSFSVIFPKSAEMKKYNGWITIKIKNV